MEENYKLVKEYRVPLEIFKEAYRSYQKKFIYPKSYIFMAIFLILAADFIVAAIKAPTNTLAYILIVVCIAFAFREWFNPRKIRNSIVDTMRELGEPLYKIAIADDYIEISTIDDGSVENNSPSDPEEEELQYHEEYEPLPEKSILQINGDLSTLEYDDYFLLLSGKRMFYILPKKGFSEGELETVRGLGNIS